MMTICESCGTMVPSDDQPFCPNCGYSLGGLEISVVQQTGLLDPMEEVSYLELLGGPEDGRIILLGSERVTVGRREDNDVHIFSDTALSRRHAFIYYKDGAFWIEDRKSSFGTWVDGERVPVKMTAMLKDGSLIRLARTEMLFFLGRPEEVSLDKEVAQIEL